MPTPDVEMIARACWEACRAFRQVGGDDSRKSWDELSQEVRGQVILKVQRILRGEIVEPTDHEDLIFKNMVRSMSS